MLTYPLIIFSTIFQEQSVAIALFVANKPFWETFFLLFAGSTLGMVIFYFFPEEFKLITGPIAKLWKIIKKRIAPESLANNIKKSRWKIRLASFQQELISKIVRNGYPQIIIFIITCLPFPGFFPIAIIAARLLKLKHGFWLIFTANIVKTFILVISVYQIGEIFKT